MKILVAPSLLACDFSRMGAEVELAEQAGADYIHVDVMDGHFVPNLTIGPVVIEKLRPHTRLPFDVHLMLDHPEVYAPQFVKAGANIVSVHVEAPGIATPQKAKQVLAGIRGAGVKCGMVLKPATPAEAVFPFLDCCDMVLVMTVEPGFGGQTFMHDMLPKIASIRNEAARRGLVLDIEVDGGIDYATSPLCAKNGANVFVAGTYLFGQKDIARRIAALHNLATIPAR